MTYDEAIAYWYGRINFEVRSAAPKDLKLERMRALLRHLNDPHDRLRIVHVTGTKGKGSTCAMLASILQQAGYRVGLFTSPHLEQVEERLQVDGQKITQVELANLMTEMAPVVALLDAGPWMPPTFFEISTALGFLHFVRRRCDVVVLEVGLGGRFDSTNVCSPMVSVITSIGLDHMAQLGNTLEEIAVEKAGIIKRGVPVVSGVVQPGPRDVIEQVATNLGCRLVQFGREFQVSYQATPKPMAQVIAGKNTNRFELNLLGAHQAVNAAVSVATVQELRRSGLHIPRQAVQAGLKQVHWPARIELVRQTPVVILDSAHNVPSAEALVKTLGESFPNAKGKRLVFAVSSDKQYAEMLAILGPFFDEFYMTKYKNNPRTVPPEKLANIVQGLNLNKPIHLHQLASESWQAALQASAPDDLICIAGSVFLAGELNQLVRATSAT